MSYLNLRLYQRNTQCLHIRKHRLDGFFVRLFVACAFAAQAPLSSAEHPAKGEKAAAGSFSTSHT